MGLCIEYCCSCESLSQQHDCIQLKLESMEKHRTLWLEASEKICADWWVVLVHTGLYLFSKEINIASFATAKKFYESKTITFCQAWQTYETKDILHQKYLELAFNTDSRFSSSLTISSSLAYVTCYIFIEYHCQTDYNVLLENIFYTISVTENYIVPISEVSKIYLFMC